jgi:parallel beta-helix repeat protein
MTRDTIFVSYSHKDVKYFKEFKTMLAPAIRQRRVKLWDDTQIPAGAVWREEIKKALASSRVAVLLVSPNFLDSDFIQSDELPALLDEVAAVTVYWVCVTTFLVNETRIGRYQAAHDCKKPLDTLKPAQRQVALTAICEKLLRIATSDEPAQARAASANVASHAGVSGQLATGRDPSPKPAAPREIRVDPHDSNHNTIVKAIRVAGPGGRVVIPKGSYRESLIIDEPVTIEGDGRREDIIIESGDENVIWFRAESGRIANLTIRFIGRERNAVKITRGNLVLEPCDISSSHLAAVSIQYAHPTVRENRICDCEQEGIWMHDGAGGKIENNEIIHNTFAGIALRGRETSPVITGNEIYECGPGIFIDDDAGGFIEGNWIADNTKPEIDQKYGHATIKNNFEYRKRR